MGGLKKVKKHVLVCEHKDCLKRGGKEAVRELKAALKESGVRGEVVISKVDCFDQCDDGPVFVVYPDGVWYGRVDERGARDIAERHVAGGRDARCTILRDMRAEGRGEG